MMLKMLLVVFLTVCGTAVFANQAAEKSEAKSTIITPVKLCWWPDIGWPSEANVWGMTLGVGNYGSVDNYVAGLDLGCVSYTNNVYGLHTSFYNVTKGTVGAQIGLWNAGENTSGTQIGLVNIGTKKSYQLQIGLWCELENGFLPAFPLINFSIK